MNTNFNINIVDYVFRELHMTSKHTHQLSTLTSPLGECKQPHRVAEHKIYLPTHSTVRQRYIHIYHGIHQYFGNIRTYSWKFMRFERTTKAKAKNHFRYNSRENECIGCVCVCVCIPGIRSVESLTYF